MIVLIAIGFIVALAALGILALRFGVDSRDGFAEKSTDTRTARTP